MTCAPHSGVITRIDHDTLVRIVKHVEDVAAVDIAIAGKRPFAPATAR